MMSIIATNLRAIPHRLAGSLVTVFGLACVVAVLLSMLAMANGVMHTIANTGRDDRAVILRSGAAAEMNSALSRDQAVAIMDAPGVKRDGAGRPVASADTLLALEIPTEAGASWANAIVRGVTSMAPALRPELALISGRYFQSGTHELIVGEKASRQFAVLQLGARLLIGNSEWQIVGVFRSGDQHESELFGDAETLAAALRRNGYQSVTVRLDAAQSFDALREALLAHPGLAVDVRRETEYFAEQSKPLTRVLSVIAFAIGGIMSLGALFGALNTMYAAVSSREREIATLRALGFGAGSVVFSVLVEALALAFIGALLGSMTAWLLFDGHVANTSVGGFTQTVFALRLTPALVVFGIVWACAVGFVGALAPALRAARAPVAQALRAT